MRVQPSSLSKGLSTQNGRAHTGSLPPLQSLQSVPAAQMEYWWIW